MLEIPRHGSHLRPGSGLPPLRPAAGAFEGHVVENCSQVLQGGARWLKGAKRATAKRQARGRQPPRDDAAELDCRGAREVGRLCGGWRIVQRA